MGVLRANVDGVWVDISTGDGSGSTGPVAYTHVQGTPAAVWMITHNLGYQPNITVVDSANEQVEGDVIYGPTGTISIIFSGAFSGVAYLT